MAAKVIPFPRRSLLATPKVEAQASRVSTDDSYQLAKRLYRLIDYKNQLTVFEKDRLIRAEDWTVSLLKEWISDQHYLEDTSLSTELKTGRTLRIDGLPSGLISDLEQLLSEISYQFLMLLHPHCLKLSHQF